MPGDIGKFVGRYLQVLAILTVVGMIVSMFRGTVELDFTFLFLFWAGAALVRHSPLGRQLVIIGAVLTCVVALAVVVAGLSSLETVQVEILGIPVEDPTRALVAGLGASLLAIATPPLGFLLTRQARREFES